MLQGQLSREHIQDVAVVEMNVKALVIKKRGICWERQFTDVILAEGRFVQHICCTDVQHVFKRFRRVERRHKNCQTFTCS